MIRNIYIIGLGALGVMFGHHIEKNLPEGCSLHFIADAQRCERYRAKTITCNGEVCGFDYVSAETEGQTADLILVATKFTGIHAAIDSIRNFVGENTILMSLLNGISSEELLIESFGKEKVLHCVARGMDAVKLGDALEYQHMGILLFGAVEKTPEMLAKVEAVHALFDEMQLEHVVSPEINKILWSKFMLNVGLNQSMMVHETNYGGVQQEGPARDDMIAAMRETVAVAEKVGVDLTEQDVREAVAIVDQMAPEGYASMRQDGINRRPSEVESFSGAVLALAERYGVDTPVNRMFYDRIKAIEADY